LPSRLPEAIGLAHDARMSAALARPVANALGAAVRENRETIVDVLFPVIGPAIRKAIAEALRTLVADLNGAIESSLTPRGIAWRFEAWRSGVPYAQVVLKHRLNFGIDHVFLIARDSGLVLARESAPHLPDLDADAVAGMLTAIGEFVRDSVAQDGGGTLDAARVGDRLLWVVPGPRANLACFIHGVPPDNLYALLQQRLEALHARFRDALDDGVIDDAARASLRPEAIVHDARAEAGVSTVRSSPWPMRLALLALSALVAWLVVRHVEHVRMLGDVRERLASQPGFVLSGIDDSRGAIVVHGLIDADADPVAPIVQAVVPSSTPVDVEATGYVSTDDAIVARRARRLLAVPSDVTIESKDGALSLRGRAPSAWIASAREHAPWIAGVRSVEIAVASSDAPPDRSAEIEAARGRLAALADALPQKSIAFVRDAMPTGDVDATLAAIAADIASARRDADIAGERIVVFARGTSDDPGSDETNARVRDARAKWLVDALAARGVANVDSTAGDENDARIGRRSAFVRIVRSATP
jgi:hypothetical protein